MEITVTKAAALLGVTQQTVRRKIESGELRGRKLFGRYRVDAKQVNKLSSGDSQCPRKKTSNPNNQRRRTSRC